MIATEYKPLAVKKFPKKPYKNSEVKRFKNFKTNKELNLNLSCCDIKFCMDVPNLVSCFVFDSVYLYDVTTDNLISKFPQIRDVITSGHIRKDGKIIFSGMENGKIAVHDTIKKSCLRLYNSHKLRVNSISISNNLVNFVSCSNDCSFNIHDLARTEPVRRVEKAHNDYIKTGCYLDENTILTGGYDKVIKVWDLREKDSSESSIFSGASYDNSSICNDILVLKTKPQLFISTADNYLRLFDIRRQEVLTTVNPIQSGISKIISDNLNSRLFVVSPNESYVKVLDLSNLSLRSLYSLNMKNPIAAFDISSDLNHMAVAFTEGDISIRSRNIEEESQGIDFEKDQEDKDLELLDPTHYAKKDIVKNYKYFYRGQYENNLEGNELHLEKGKKRKLQQYDIYLKKFQYHKALDCVLTTRNVELVMTVIEELLDRNALKLALLNRSEEDLEILLNFILWKIRDTKVMNQLLFVFNLLIDYYMVVAYQNEKIKSLFNKISNAIKEEITYETKLMEIDSNIQSLTNVYHFMN